MGIKVVLITTGQPSVNPRIVKEAEALHCAGYAVTILYCFWTEWAVAPDAALLAKVKWDHRLIGGSATANKSRYVYTKARRRLNQFFHRHFGNKFLFAERSQARCFSELLKVARSIKADWYIGHNLGALPIAVKSAAFHEAKAAFDFEDYHREESNDISPHIRKRIAYLEEKYVKHLRYFSTASPMITEKVKKNFPSFNRQAITLLNCFPLAQQPHFIAKSREDNTLRLFWFSQTIGKERGLEILIQVLGILNDPLIYLTLAGNCDKDFRVYLDQAAIEIKNKISLAGIIEPANLPRFAAAFDVGMAIELPAPENRNICLTNKIFTYLLAGNAIILSNTAMQVQFNNTYKIGETFTVDNKDELKDKILFYKNKHNLEPQRRHNYELAKHKMNWENESKKLLDIVT